VGSDVLIGQQDLDYNFLWNNSEARKAVRRYWEEYHEGDRSLKALTATQFMQQHTDIIESHFTFDVFQAKYHMEKANYFKWKGRHGRKKQRDTARRRDHFAG
jgi:hypothetical protein